MQKDIATFCSQRKFHTPVAAPRLPARIIIATAAGFTPILHITTAENSASAVARP
jgi:hypothetical protein